MIVPSLTEISGSGVGGTDAVAVSGGGVTVSRTTRVDVGAGVGVALGVGVSGQVVGVGGSAVRVGGRMGEGVAVDQAEAVCDGKSGGIVGAAGRQPARLTRLAMPRHSPMITVN